MKRAVTQYRRLVGFWSAVVSVACVAGLSACGGPETGPEDQLRQWVNRGEEAVEAKQRRELIDMISPAYTDARGNDRGDIENILRVYFFRQNSIT